MSIEQYFLWNAHEPSLMCTYSGSEMEGWDFPQRFVKSRFKYHTCPWWNSCTVVRVFSSSVLILILPHYGNMKALWFKVVLSDRWAAAWSAWLAWESLSAALFVELLSSPPHSIAPTCYIRRVLCLVCFPAIFSLS